MANEMSPAAMLEAAMNGELKSDDDQDTKTPQDDEQGNTVQDTSADDKPAGKVDTPKVDEEPEGAPIASKSGAYTIPFEKLTTARQERDQAKAEAENLRQQLDALTSKQQANLEQAQARADAGEGGAKAGSELDAAKAAISEGIDPNVFGDFSEEGIAKGIQTLLAQQSTAIRAELKAEFEKELAPQRAERAKTQVESHYAPIYAKHADADEIIESGEFKQWIAGLPSFTRDGVNNAMAKGSTEQVIEVFDSFKASTGSKPPVNTQATSLEVQRRVPASLSEINGSAPVDTAQQTLAIANNPAALLDRMGSMTPEQIDALMNRV